MSFKIDNAIEKLRKAIIELQKPQPFFAHLLMRMKVEEMPANSPMPTVGVDQYGKLSYNEEWVMGLPDSVMTGLMCHEILHVALLHMARTGSRDHMVANIAQDVVVNSICLKAGLNLPEGGIPYNTYRDCSDLRVAGIPVVIEKVSEKSWEMVYDEIHSALKKAGKSPQKQQGGGQGGQGQPQQGQGNGQGNSEGFDHHDRSNKGQSSEKRDANAQKWQTNLAEAATYAKQQGKLPAGMGRIVDKLLKPQVQWKAMLMKYLKPYVIPVDWSYQRPHKKSKVLGVFLPSTLKEHTEVEVLVDTSGSIAKKELTEFISEIVGIAQSMTHIDMTVTFIDSKIHSRYVVQNGDIPKILAMEPKGGGGTDMEEGLDYIKQQNSQVPVTIVLTDGYTSFNKRRNDYPFEVIWVINKHGIGKSEMNNRIPYGVKIKME